MPPSFSVDLPAGRVPRFPDRCIVCREPGPGSVFEVGTHTLSIASAFFIHGWGAKHVGASIPACVRCARELRRSRRVCTAVLCILAIAAVAPVFYVMVEMGLHGPQYKLLAMGASVVLLAPWIVWELFHPPVFDLTATSSTTTYELRDREDALAFAELNGVKLDGDRGATSLREAGVGRPR
ncbi:hypothetical protein HY251_02535 [bacterium]|nr:hypothetical protein [bacterium]